MSTTANAPHAAIATLSLPLKVPALIQYALGIAKAMTGNTSFPNPTWSCPGSVDGLGLRS
jgi:hypothetical protein